MKKSFPGRISHILMLFSFLICQTTWANEAIHYVPLLKEMFTKVTIAKNAEAIPVYYDQGFELYSNGNKMTLNEFIHLHQSIYKTPIQYKIRYDENTLMEQGNKVAGRLFITTKKPHEAAHEIEVMLIAEYKNDKLYRLWELTYPDWSKMKAFQKVSMSS
jgi:hypothetical protein